MNDAEARRLLTGIDAPRAMPPSVRADLESALALGDVDAARALPEDLRQRLEATLLGESVVVPATVRRRLHREVAGTRTARRVASVAAVVLLLVGGIIAIGGRETDEPGTDVAVPAARTPTTATTQQASGTATGSAGSAGGFAPTPSAAQVPFASGDAMSGGSAAGGASAPATGAPISITMVGDGGSDVAQGFNAYLATLDERGGIGGRRLEVTNADDAVVTVNVGQRPSSVDVKGVLLESLAIEDARLRGTVTSLSSPLERQARLAVAHAFPDDAPGVRAAIYMSADEPWRSTVADAFDAELRERGVTPVRVPFNAAAPTFVVADAAFLGLATADAAAWIDAAPGAPARGAWGIATAWDDARATRAAEVGVHVLSSYRPISGDEATALRTKVGDRPLNASLVHGWVTAKAIAVLLATTGADEISTADLDALAGWDPVWAPPFEVRSSTRARTPEAILLEPDGDVFVARGAFERA